MARQDNTELERSFNRIETEVERLDHLVGELLTLSRIESSIAHSEDVFDLSSLLKEIVVDSKFEASPKDVEILFTPPKSEMPCGYLCAGKSRLVRSAIENVVRNAIRFSEAGQTIVISLERQRADVAIIEISDEGPGIPPEILGKIFQPFYKGEKSHDGFGLGLAIARRVVAAHGGTFIVRNRITKGLVVTIELPLVGVHELAAGEGASPVNVT